MRERFEKELAYIQTLEEYKLFFTSRVGNYKRAKNPVMKWVSEHMKGLLDLEVETLYSDLYAEGLARAQIELWLEEDKRYDAPKVSVGL